MAVAFYLVARPFYFPATTARPDMVAVSFGLLAVDAAVRYRRAPRAILRDRRGRRGRTEPAVSSVRHRPGDSGGPGVARGAGGHAHAAAGRALVCADRRARFLALASPDPPPPGHLPRAVRQQRLPPRGPGTRLDLARPVVRPRLPTRSNLGRTCSRSRLSCTAWRWPGERWRAG